MQTDTLERTGMEETSRIVAGLIAVVDLEGSSRFVSLLRSVSGNGEYVVMKRCPHAEKADEILRLPDWRAYINSCFEMQPLGTELGESTRKAMYIPCSGFKHNCPGHPNYRNSQ